MAGFRAAMGLLHLLAAGCYAGASIWVGARRSRRHFQRALQGSGMSPQGVARLTEEFGRSVRLPDWRRRGEGSD